MFSWLFGPRGGEAHDVVLYTRAGCQCCEAAHAELHRAGRRYSLALRVVDIDADDELVRQYGLEVPVVMIDGKVRFRGKVNRVLLERLLRAK